jgi:hypothetical protein
MVVRAIVLGGLMAGMLDLIDAWAFSYAWRGVRPLRVLHAIASGVLGRAAFDGGIRTATLGLAIHFAIAVTVAAVYTLASVRLRVLTQHAVACGIVYGIAVYFAMQHIVLPLSAFRTGAFAWPSFINGIVIHGLGVGLPIAIIARREMRKHAEGGCRSESQPFDQSVGERHAIHDDGQGRQRV